MQTQEAIKRIRECMNTPNFQPYLYMNEALNEAIEALEKQIPKKPNLEGDGYDPDGNLVYDTWICPNCEKDYEVDYEEYDYCPNCGQSIEKLSNFCPNCGADMKGGAE